jgi:hypothetical protein
MKRTPQEETVRQLKILNAQRNPMGAFIRLTIWVVGAVVIFGLMIQLSTVFSH